MELPLWIKSALESNVAKEMSGSLHQHQPVLQPIKCEVLGDVIKQKLPSTFRLHPMTIVFAQKIVESVIRELLRLSRTISDYHFRMEQSQEDFLYAVDYWIRNLVQDRSVLCLEKGYTGFVSMNPNEICPSELEEDEEEDANEEDYESEEQEGESGEEDSSPSDEESWLVDETEIDQDPEEFTIEEDVEQLFESEEGDDEAESEKNPFESEPNSQSNPSEETIKEYETLSGVKLQKFRKYCQNVLIEGNAQGYALIHDDVLISLHQFIYSQLLLSFQSNPTCLFTKAGYFPLGFMNQSFLVESVVAEQEKVSQDVYSTVEKQQSHLKNVNQKSADLVQTLQDLIHALKGIQSPSSSDKENRPIMQSPTIERSIKRKRTLEATSKGYSSPDQVLLATPEKQSDLIAVHPHLLNTLAKQLKESEERVLQLKTELSISRSSDSSIFLSAKKEQKLKSLVRALDRLANEEEDDDDEESENSARYANASGKVTGNSRSSHRGDDAQTETFHRYPFNVADESLDEMPALARGHSSEPNVNLLQRFGSASSHYRDEEEIRPSTEFTTEIAFNSAKKRKYGLLETSDPQYIYGSPDWNEKIEIWQKRLRQQQVDKSTDDKNTTPNLFDKYK